MNTFKFCSAYSGETDYEFWWLNETRRATRRGRLLTLLSIDNEAVAIQLAGQFNDEMEARNLHARDQILTRYDEEMLRAVWQPWQPITTVQFVVGGKVIEREVLK